MHMYSHAYTHFRAGRSLQWTWKRWDGVSAWACLISLSRLNQKRRVRRVTEETLLLLQRTHTGLLRVRVRVLTQVKLKGDNQGTIKSMFVHLNTVPIFYF